MIRRAGIGAALAAVVLVAAASANTASFRDPAGDVTGGPGGADYDVVRVGHGHRGGLLVHTVRTRGAHTDDSPSPEMFIRVGSGRKPDFQVTASGVFRAGTGSGLRKVGNANLVAPSARTFELRFRAKAINGPREYEWRMYMGAVGSTIDRAPGRYVTHVLR